MPFLKVGFEHLLSLPPLGLLITGGGPWRGGGRYSREMEVFPANARCTLPPKFPDLGEPPLAPSLNGEPPLAPSLNGDPCHREGRPHSFCSERDSCGVWWSGELYHGLLHLLEERAEYLGLAGNRGWISHLEVELRDIMISILNSPP